MIVYNDGPVQVYAQHLAFTTKGMRVLLITAVPYMHCVKSLHSTATQAANNAWKVSTNFYVTAALLHWKI